MLSLVHQLLRQTAMSAGLQRAPINIISSSGSPLLSSPTFTRRSGCQLSPQSLAAAHGVALTQAFAVVSRLHSPSVTALLARDLVAEWLHTSRFGQPGGVWLTHVLPAVLSFLQGGLEDVLMLPDQDLPEAQSRLKVCSEVQIMLVHCLCTAEHQQHHVLSLGCPQNSMLVTSSTCIKSGINLTSNLRMVPMHPVLAVTLMQNLIVTMSV